MGPCGTDAPYGCPLACPRKRLCWGGCPASIGRHKQGVDAIARAALHLQHPQRGRPRRLTPQTPRHARLLFDFAAALRSGCTGNACPGLSGPAGGCMRIGDRLADIPGGWSDFTLRCAWRQGSGCSLGQALRGIAAGRRPCSRRRTKPPACPALSAAANPHDRPQPGARAGLSSRSSAPAPRAARTSRTRSRSLWAIG